MDLGTQYLDIGNRLQGIREVSFFTGRGGHLSVGAQNLLGLSDRGAKFLGHTIIYEREIFTLEGSPIFFSQPKGGQFFPCVKGGGQIFLPHVKGGPPPGKKDSSLTLICRILIAIWR